MCGRTMSGINKRLAVIQFKKLPKPCVSIFECVPKTWIKNWSYDDNHVDVAFPNKDMPRPILDALIRVQIYPLMGWPDFGAKIIAEFDFDELPAIQKFLATNDSLDITELPAEVLSSLGLNKPIISASRTSVQNSAAVPNGRSQLYISDSVGTKAPKPMLIKINPAIDLRDTSPPRVTNKKCPVPASNSRNSSQDTSNTQTLNNCIKKDPEEGTRKHTSPETTPFSSDGTPTLVSLMTNISEEHSLRNKSPASKEAYTTPNPITVKVNPALVSNNTKVHVTSNSNSTHVPNNISSECDRSNKISSLVSSSKSPVYEASVGTQIENIHSNKTAVPNETSSILISSKNNPVYVPSDQIPIYEPNKTNLKNLLSDISKLWTDDTSDTLVYESGSKNSVSKSSNRSGYRDSSNSPVHESSSPHELSSEISVHELGNTSITPQKRSSSEPPTPSNKKTKYDNIPNLISPSNNQVTETNTTKEQVNVDKDTLDKIKQLFNELKPLIDQITDGTQD